MIYASLLVKFAAKYELQSLAIDQYIFDPETNQPIIPKFETGDLVGSIFNSQDRGKYISSHPTYQDIALVQWLDHPIGDYTTEREGNLVLIKKRERLETQAHQVYGPYTRKSDGRQLVIVIDDQGKRRTVSYPKYLVEQRLGRQLDPDLETIDHYNGDIYDNDENNLRIVPRAEHSSMDVNRVKNIKFTCPMCKEKFERSPRLIRDKSKKGKAGPFCSKVCAGKYGKMLQTKVIKKWKLQPFIESEYYKKKYLE